MFRSLPLKGKGASPGKERRTPPMCITDRKWPERPPLRDSLLPPAPPRDVPSRAHSGAPCPPTATPLPYPRCTSCTWLPVRRSSGCSTKRAPSYPRCCSRAPEAHSVPQVITAPSGGVAPRASEPIQGYDWSQRGGHRSVKDPRSLAVVGAATPSEPTLTGRGGGRDPVRTHAHWPWWGPRPRQNPRSLAVVGATLTGRGGGRDPVTSGSFHSDWGGGFRS
ncbi:unnamed protein product [Boreogadus saida]